MARQLTAEHFQQIRATMEQYDVRFWGLRVDFADAAFDADAELPPSRVWVDGTPTSEVLPGTSAVGLSVDGSLLASLDSYITARLADARDEQRQEAVRVMLIGSDSATAGDDDGEYLIANAHCYWSVIL